MPEPPSAARPPTPAPDVPWTTRRLLAWMHEHFARHDVDAPRLVAEMLLTHVLGCPRMRLYMEVDRPASEEERVRLRELVRRAADHEPVQYLVGTTMFYGAEFAVDRSTMIPQPCTEGLVQRVLEWLGPRPAERPDALIADLGTGSGCIAISLAVQAPRVHVIATDVVPDALELAARNAAALGVDDRVEFRAGPLLTPLAGRDEPFDVICGNLPYIPNHEWDGGLVQRAVKEYVPATALRGGADGLDFIRPAVEGAPDLLRPGGLLMLEIADSQRDAARAVADAVGGYASVDVLKDDEGFWRFLVAERA